MASLAGCDETIVTCGGTNPYGSHPRIVGRRSTGARAMSACRIAPTRAPPGSRSPHSSIVHVRPTTWRTTYAAAVMPSSAMKNCTPRDNGRQVSRLTATDERHGSAVPWRLRDAEFGLAKRDFLESVSIAPRRIQGREEQAHLSAFMRRFIEQPFDQGPCVTMAAVHRLGENRADAADPYRPLIEDTGDEVAFRAGEQLGTIDEREPLLMIASPCGSHLSRMIPSCQIAWVASRRRSRTAPSAGTTVITSPLSSRAEANGVDRKHGN